MKYLPRKNGNLTFISCMWIMTMNQHEGTYSAATRVTYRCKIAWLYFRLDSWSNLTGSRISLIYFYHYFLYCVRPLYTRSSRLPLTGGQYRDGAGLSIHSNTHDTHAIEGKHGPRNTPRSQNELCNKNAVSATQSNSTTVEADTKRLLFF